MENLKGELDSIQRDIDLNPFNLEIRKNEVDSLQQLQDASLDEE